MYYVYFIIGAIGGLALCVAYCWLVERSKREELKHGDSDMDHSDL